MGSHSQYTLIMSTRVGVEETNIDTRLIERKLSKCMCKSSSADESKGGNTLPSCKVVVSLFVNIDNTHYACCYHDNST